MAAVQPRTITGVVVSHGKMMKTVKVRIPGQQWDKHIRKFYNKPSTLLVHDPNSSLLTGDIITLSPHQKISRHCRHIVTSIVSPFGPPLSARPPLPTAEQLEHRKSVIQEAIQTEEKRLKAEASGRKAGVDEVLYVPNGGFDAKGGLRRVGGLEVPGQERSRWEAEITKAEKAAKHLEHEGETADVYRRAYAAMGWLEELEKAAKRGSSGGSVRTAAAEEEKGRLMTEEVFKARAEELQRKDTIREENKAERAEVRRQKQIERTLPGGLHATGPIQERAQDNRRKEAKFAEKGLRNEAELDAVRQDIQEKVSRGEEMGRTS